MKVFHGTAEKDFKIHTWKKSRYGFPVLFFATELKLAELFAIHHAQEKNLIHGYIFEATINEPVKSIDFGGRMSYDPVFRHTIYKLRDEKIPSVRFTRIIDFPSHDLIVPNKSNVIAVFDFNEIQKIQPKFHLKTIA